MLKKKIGFIGGGNMSNAIISALAASGTLAPASIQIFDRKPATNKRMAEQYGITAAHSAGDLASEVDILVIAVKPNAVLSVLADLQEKMQPHTLVVSIAAGVALATLESLLGDKRKIVRVMPNTPAMVNEAMSSVTPNRCTEQQDIDDIIRIFSSFGRAEVVAESMIHAVTGASGSAPAYVFMLIEAMADAAVLGGMPRAQAYRFCAQAVKGAAQMVLETGQHPGELKDRVCSPGGTTIEAVKVLEQKGLRSAVIEAMQKCMDKSAQMSRQA